MAIKLLLVQDVDDLGRSGDVVKVKPGFARNYLLPQGLAIFADSNALRMQARLQEERKKKAEEDRKLSETLAKSLDGLMIQTIVKVDQEGHMYGSVTQLDIVHLLAEQHSIEIEKRNVHLQHPIKTTGVHEIDLKLKEGVEARITLKVIPEAGEGSIPQEAEATAPTEEVEQ